MSYKQKALNFETESRVEVSRIRCMAAYKDAADFRVEVRPRSSCLEPAYTKIRAKSTGTISLMDDSNEPWMALIIFRNVCVNSHRWQ
jgi:hypothetical protein